MLSWAATNSAGIENRTNCENTGAITVNGFGVAAEVSACDGSAEAQSRPSATMAAKVLAIELMAGASLRIHGGSSPGHVSVKYLSRCEGCWRCTAG